MRCKRSAIVCRRQPRDRVPGGKARRRRPRDFNQTQLRIGTCVELEHTRDPCIAQEIAMDHLVEDPAYYRKLRRVHLDGGARKRRR